MRGQLDDSSAYMYMLRIIPARAGPTRRAWYPHLSPTDHPRSCGANGVGFVVVHATSGSSPLVRGQRFRTIQWRFRVRIIPARAGPTSRIRGNGMFGADHPRSCGANKSHANALLIRRGSSPLVRGQPGHFHGVQRVVRIIPARAGPTPSTPSTSLLMSDHPRSCGANASAAPAKTPDAGSSPLVRGQHGQTTIAQSRRRIIPARAGPTGGRPQTVA